ncbi:hypothetical protein ANCCAN_17187 [Ancylostoma caninum]|uniref:Uncharacterized protein n=1 Tax=Ancylostoma caninum TaxID=29170 RepID=A0A368FXK9_ANCCA|nr:hypothetical protein ANCCAN_17187 [Ancylostoma caninum]
MKAFPSTLISSMLKYRLYCFERNSTNRGFSMRLDGFQQCEERWAVEKTQMRSAEEML